jgi:hypothetical protein
MVKIIEAVVSGAGNTTDRAKEVLSEIEEAGMLPPKAPLRAADGAVMGWDYYWEQDDPEGKRADLREADLTGADLTGADLTGTILENKPILNFQYKRHLATFIGNNEIKIGCHSFSIEHWLANYKEIGKQFGYSDIEIAKYGSLIKGCANIQKELDQEI